MILPGSYANGFAPRDGQPLYPELWRGCVGAWTPCLGPTGLTLRDWSGYGNHGVLTNGPSWTSSQGRHSLSYDDIDDRVVCGNAPALSTNNYSIAMWYFPYSVSGAHGIFDQWNAGNFGVLAFRSGSSVAFQVGAGGNRVTMSGLTANTWQHLYMENANGSLRVVINAAVTSTIVAAGTTVNTQSLIIGSRNVGGVGFADAMIEDFRIYDRPLSSRQNQLLASRRGIAYELAPRRRASVQVVGGFKAAWIPRQRLIVGGGL